MSFGRSGGGYWPLDWAPSTPTQGHQAAPLVTPPYSPTYADWMPRPLSLRRATLDPVLTRADQAMALVTHFERVGAAGVFTRIRSSEVARDLRMRLRDAANIDQGASRLCGPAAFVAGVLVNDPVEYVNFVTGLYSTGSASLRTLAIRAGSDVRRYNPAGRIAAADWIALASIRDSENWFFDYQSADDAFPGITLPSELEAWFKKIGYQSVINKTSLTHDEGQANLRQADRLFGDGYWVCLLVNASVLYTDTQKNTSIVPDHWVVLRSRIRFGAPFYMEVLTWGQSRRSVPQKPAIPLSAVDFLNHYNGFVAAKY
jgi:hypothetical protein